MNSTTTTTETGAAFAPLSPVLEQLAQAMRAFLDDAECEHVNTYTQRSNSGDGSARYDFTATTCSDCGFEVG